MTTTGWAELYVRREWRTEKVTSRHSDPWSARTETREERRAHWELPDTLHVYDANWKNDFILDRHARQFKGEFTVRNQANPGDKYATGGHNWYMTTRFDVWFTHPHDGYQWHGWLITGGDNTTFRVRRTKDSPLFRPRDPDDFWAEPPKLRQPVIIPLPDVPGVLAVRDGGEDRWFAKQFSDGWHIAPTVGEVFASRLLRQQAA